MIITTRNVVIKVVSFRQVAQKLVTETNVTLIIYAQNLKI